MSVENKMHLIKPDPPQYSLFKDYAVAVKDFLTNVVYLKRFPRDKQTNIYYSTPQRAWANQVQPVVNGFSETPVCVFNLSAMEFKTSEIMGGFVTLTEEHPTDKNKLIVNYSPTIWELTYDVTIWTKLMNDMDMIMSQIFIYALPPKCWATRVNETWAEIYVESNSIEDELEPGDAKDKVIRRSVVLKIRRAYLPREAYDVSKINQILFDIKTI